MLSGNAGDDSLRGGSGRDTCKGGSGADNAKGCETTIGVDLLEGRSLGVLPQAAGLTE
ncbi:MAG: hypothetical protein GY720_18315 [bacterium]|nr:hypothetical protein [bacterium]